MTAIHFCLLAFSLVAAAPGAAAGPALDAKIKEAEAALMGDPGKALGLAREARRIAGGEPAGAEATTAMATALWLEAESLIGLNRTDEARGSAEQAILLVSQGAARSKLAGDINRTVGALAGIRGDTREALRRYQAAHAIFAALGDQRSQSIALLDIGQIYWDAGDYARVLQYFDQSAEMMPAGDASLRLALHNGRGEVLRAMGRVGEAITEFAKARQAAATLKSDMLQVRILTNLGNAQIAGGRIDQAAATLRRASLMSAAPDMAEWRPYIHAALARVAERKGDLATAERELGLTFAGVDIAKTAMSYREAHELAAAVFERRGRTEDAFRHLRAFQRLDKEAQQLIATNSAQLMAAQFDFTNQNLRISQLKQGQLQRDIQIERQRARYRTNLFLGLFAAGAIVLGIALYGFFSVRRSRNQVRAVNIELEGSNADLEKALKAKSEFLATTSHEIRTPLNGILGMTQVLLANRGIDAEVREKIEVVHGAGETMQALVDDLLDVAKMEHGQLTLTVAPTDITRLVDDVVRLWRPSATAKGLDFIVDVGDLPPTVCTDGARLRQILFNLLSNAIKFTPQGHVALECALLQGGEGPRLVMRVRDSGIGIAPDHHASIFEAFSQVDGGTTRQFSGTGLGLSIVHSLAAALGGTIAVESAPGAGATFTLTLPVAIDAESDRPASGGLAQAKVLVVDGNVASQAILRILLAPLAADVAATESIGAAGPILAAGAVDLVLVDCAALTGAPQDILAALGDLAALCRSQGGRLSLLHAGDAAIPISALFTVGASQIIVKPIPAPEMLEALSALWSDDPPAFVAPSLAPTRHAA